MTIETTTQLVCSNCGSDRIGTVERAYIWQTATFRLTDGDSLLVETAEGDPVDIEWDAYDSDDVGDTDSVGYFCKNCLGTWQNDDGEGLPACPFVPQGTPPTHEWS